MSHWQEWRDDGRLSREAWLWLLPVSIASAMAYQPTGSTIPTWMLALFGLLGQFALALAWLAARLLPVRVWVVVIACVLGAALRAATTSLLAVAAGASGSPWERFAPGVVIFSIASFLASWAVAARRRVHRANGALIAESEVCRREIARTQDELQRLRADLKARIAKEAGASVDVEEFLGSSVPAIMRELRGPSARTRRLSVIAQGVLRDDPFPRWWVGAALVALCATAAVTSLGPGVGLVVLVSIFVSSEVALRIVDRVTRARQRASNPVNGVVVVAGWIAAASVTGLAVWALPVATSRWQHLPVLIALLMLAFEIAIAAIASARRQVLVVRSELGSQALALNRELQVLQGQVRAERTRLARLVHGDLQSRLAALQLASANGSSVDLDAEIEAFLAQVDDDGDPRAFTAWIEDLRALWALSCAITVTGADQVTTASAESMIALCEEAVANAIVHGRARNISIAMTQAAGVMQLSVRSDGAPPPSRPIAGNGMAIFAEYSRSFTLVEGDGGGSQFDAVVGAPLTATSAGDDVTLG